MDIFFLLGVLLFIGSFSLRPKGAQKSATSKSIPLQQQTSAAVKSPSIDKKDLDQIRERAIAEADRAAREQAERVKAEQAEAERRRAEASRLAREKVAQLEAERVARQQAQQAEAKRKAEQEFLETLLVRERAQQAERDRLAREQAQSKQSSLLRDAPRQSLRYLVTEYGRSICNDPLRCRSLLLDVCGEYKREINILMAVLEEHVVADLLAPPVNVPRDIFLARLTTRVYENRALSEEVAHWGIQTWIFALDL